MSRILVVPKNPRTDNQLNRREVLSRLARTWRNITEEQRLAWNTAGKSVRSQSRLGESGTLSGFLLFVKLNANLLIVGEPTVSSPPTVPEFGANVVQGLELTNTSGVVAVKLICSGSSDAFNLVWGAPPTSAGRFAMHDYYYLGELPEVSGGKANITALYTAKFGAPAAGQKLFIRSKQMEDGYEDLPRQWSGIVPAAS